MTMLDRMRRHKAWLKWSLALVVLAFIIFYIPAFLGHEDTGQGAPSDAVASVDGQRITVDDFQRSYQNQIQVYRNAYGGNVSEQMLKQLGIGQQILQQMVDEQASLTEASRQNISVSDAELESRIVTMPGLQENGQFVGRARYEGILRMQRPPMSTAQFEENLRRSLIVEKLRSAVTGWLTVPEKDLEQEFQRRNEKVKLEMVAVPADKFRSEVTIADGDLPPYFDAHKEQYRVGEKRKIRYLLVSVDALRATSQPSQREVERFYNDNIEMYSTPEQVRASQILLKTEGKKDEEVKAKAEQVLKEAKSPGADFAALAKKYSEDEVSAKQGGDLDFFTKGRNVPEFDEVAFTLQPGQVSDLVKSQYGYHIIKVTDKKPASTRSLEEVRPQIVDQLTYERAQTKAADLAAQMEKEISKPADLDKAAASHGLKVQESGFFTREEPIMGLGPSPQAAAEAFTIKPGELGGPVQVSGGFAFLTVTGTEAPRLPSLDEVKNRVKEDLTKQKAKEIALQKATALAAAAKGGDLAKAAKAAGFEVKTTELVPRESPLPEIGASPEVDAVVFALPQGTVSDPIVTDNAVAVAKVVEHKVPTAAEFAAERDRLRGEMLSDRRGRFFSAYMQKAKQKMKIEVFRDNIQRVIG